MSGSEMTADGLPAGLEKVRARWGWFVAFGIALIVLGVVAWIEVVAVTLVSVVFIGAAMLVGGVLQVGHAFMTKGWGGFFLHLAGGVLYVVGGFLIMDEPVTGSVVITLMLAAVMVVGGILRIVIALRHRELRGWWLGVLGGIVTFALGVLLYVTLPWSGLWVLGTLVAVELVMVGATWLQFGLLLRKHARA